LLKLAWYVPIELLVANPWNRADLNLRYTVLSILI